MEIVKLKPAVKDYIWGGNKLKKLGKESASENIAECWELSFNEDGPSIIDSGINKGKRLLDIAKKDDLGNKIDKYPFFPVLVKLINSASNLSVQVHPSDEYALKNENQFGKTEMWHILAHDEGAGIYLGFKEDAKIEDIKKALEEGSILSYLNFIPVKNGDTYFIPSGTIHAIGAGITLIEIQQNSTLTYRLYDYDRVDKDGNKRPLHIAKALKVLDYKKYKNIKFKDDVLGECDYFVVKEKKVKTGEKLKANDSSFLAFNVSEGEGKFEGIDYKVGDTFFIPSKKEGTFKGNAKIITITLP